MQNTNYEELHQSLKFLLSAGIPNWVSMEPGFVYIPDVQVFTSDFILTHRLTLGVDLPSRTAHVQLREDFNDDNLSTFESSIMTEIKSGVKFFQMPLDREGNMDLFKFRHNLVHSGLTITQSATDVRICDVLGIYSDESNHRTPDLIVKLRDESMQLKNVFVVETKTTNDESLESTYATSVKLYEDALVNRAKHFGYKIVYYTLVVSDRRVMTNLPFEGNKAWIDSLVAHYQLGNRMRYVAMQAGWTNNLVSDNINEFTGFWEAVSRAGDLKFIPKQSDIQSDAPMITREWLRHLDQVSKDVKENYESYVARFAKSFFDQAINLMEKEKKEGEETDLLLKFMKQWEETPNARNDSLKSVVRLPFLEQLKPAEDVPEIPNFNLDTDKGPLFRLWGSALEWASDNQNFWETDLEALKVRSLQEPGLVDEKSFKGLRNMTSFKTVKLDYSDDLELLTTLATKGVETLRNRMETSAEVQDAHEMSKRPLGPSTYTNDIKSLLYSKVPFEKSLTRPLVVDRIGEIAKISEDVIKKAGFKLRQDVVEAYCDWYRNTKIYGALALISEVMEELSVSVLQKRQKGEYIMKRLRNFPVYLLVKPTTETGPIFVSLLWSEADMKVTFDESSPCFGVFKKHLSDGRGHCLTEFVSFGAEDISELIGCAEVSMAILATWCDSVGCTPDIVMHDTASPLRTKILRHAMAGFLVMLECSGTTSQALQQTRYIYVKGFGGDMLVPSNPTLLLEKLPKRIHSRLLAYFYHNIGSVSNQLKMKKPVFGKQMLQKLVEEGVEDEISGEVISGCPSYVDLEDSPSFQFVMTLSYLGYLHNKDKSSDKIHGYLKIFEKIIAEELKMHDGTARKEFMGWNSEIQTDKINTHEFNLEYVCLCGESVRRMLSNKFSGCVESWFTLAMTERWVSRSADFFATLKSSVVPKLFDTYFPGSRSEPRVKCLEAINEFLTKFDCVRPFDIIDEVLDSLESELGYILTEAFEKKQIGGPREIIIMEIRSRIVVHFLECVAWVISKESSVDYMTRGTNLNEIMSKHLRDVFEEKKKYKSDGRLSSVRVCSGDDKTTYCQMFIMRCILAPLKAIVPETVFLICSRIMNLHTKKRIYLPTPLLDLFYNNTDIYGFSEEINELKKQFLGLSDQNTLIDKFGRYLKNTSNFGQGLMGTTANVLSIGDALTLEVMIRSIHEDFIRQCKEIGKEIGPIILTSCRTSDDSALITEIPEIQRGTATVLRNISQIYHYMQKVSARAAGSRYSDPKSLTGATESMIEFKSQFMPGNQRGNTESNPAIKFVHAALKATGVADVLERQRTYSNLKSEVVAQGGSIWLARVVESAQEHIHYLFMGANMDPLWEDYTRDLKEKPHPIFGLFLRDIPAACGLFGFNFALWFHVVNSEEVNAMEASLYNHFGIEFDSTLKPCVRLTFTLSTARKYKEMVAKADIPLGLNMRTVENPEQLYRMPKNLDEVRLRVWRKFTAPGVQESLSFKHESRVHAMSLYKSFAECMLYIDKTGDEPVLKRVSMSKAFTWFYPSVTLTPDQMDIIFSNQDTYRSLVVQLKPFSDAILSKLPYMKPVREINITLDSRSAQCSISLMNVLRRKWWKHKVAGSGFEHTIAWRIYKQMFPWLSETEGLIGHNETLEQSPFASPEALSDFVTSLSPTFRTTSILAPIRGNLPMMALISKCVEGAYAKGYALKHTTTRYQPVKNPLSSILSLIQQGPPVKEESMLDRIRYYLIKLPPQQQGPLSQESLLALPTKIANLAVIQEFVRRSSNKEDPMTPQTLFDFIFAAARGNWSVFEVRQTRLFRPGQAPIYTGTGVICGCYDGSYYKVFLIDSLVTKIEADIGLLRLMRSFRYVWRGFREDYRLTGVKLSEDYDRVLVRGHVDFDTGLLVDTGAPNSIPLVILNHVEGVKILPNTIELRTTEVGGIRLCAKNRLPNGETGYVTILKFNPSNYMFTPDIDRANLDYEASKRIPQSPAWSSWLNYSPMQVQDFPRWMGEVINNGLEKTMDWVVKSIISNCQSRGWTSSNMLPLALEIEEHDSVSVEPIDVAFLREAGVFSLGITQEDILPNLEEEPENLGVNWDHPYFSFTGNVEDEDIVDLLVSDEVNLENYSSSINLHKIHPIWNAILDHAFAKIQTQLLELILSNYYVHIVHTDAVITALTRLFKPERRPQRQLAPSQPLANIPVDNAYSALDDLEAV
jgi:hypothetical protein